MAVTTGMLELASGVDALYLSGRAAVPQALLAQLETARALADELRETIPFRLAGEQLQLLPHGFGRYRYCLRHEHAQIGVSASEHLPALRVQLRAEYLRAVGPEAAVEWVRELFARDIGAVRLTVSRLDLFADFQGWHLSGDDRHRFVVRGRELDTYEDGRELSGFVFGRRTTNTILARIYDKQRDVQRTGADYWHAIWGPDYDESRPVHRIEFEIGRTGLREYGIDTPEDALGAAGALWASLTETWLTYRSPTGDATKSRWPVASEWRAVQHARIRDDAAGLERVTEGRRTGALRQLMPRLVGEMASFAVIVGTYRLSDTLLALIGAVHDHEQERQLTFEDKVRERRAAEATRSY
jgi:hypothetical protein